MAAGDAVAGKATAPVLDARLRGHDGGGDGFVAMTLSVSG
jgi:hypothetical protein|tara:strand:+ start:574 stop:693 length:120 start_codon:yes stop_codon:yes gene_type:complete